MNKLYLNDYLNRLHQDIAGSVERIKRNSKSGVRPEDKKENDSYSPTVHSRVEGYAYKLLESGVSYRLLDYTREIPVSAGYAASSYTAASQADKRPSVLIDFMFKNNREFDFKV